MHSSAVMTALAACYFSSSSPLPTQNQRQLRRYTAFQFKSSAGRTYFHRTLRNFHVFLHDVTCNNICRQRCVLSSSLNGEELTSITDTLIEQSRQRLPWEEEEHSINNNIDIEMAYNANLADYDAINQRWETMKDMLLKLKVLPPVQHQTDNNNNPQQQQQNPAIDSTIENHLLHSTPQLLRLSPLQIKNTVKSTESLLNLPPSIFYRETLLLTLQFQDISLGFDQLILEKAKQLNCDNTNDDDTTANYISSVEECDVDVLECTIDNIRKSVVEDIVRMPRILLDAAVGAKGFWEE